MKEQLCANICQVGSLKKKIIKEQEEHSLATETLLLYIIIIIIITVTRVTQLNIFINHIQIYWPIRPVPSCSRTAATVYFIGAERGNSQSKLGSCKEHIAV